LIASLKPPAAAIPGRKLIHAIRGMILPRIVRITMVFVAKIDYFPSSSSEPQFWRQPAFGEES